MVEQLPVYQSCKISLFSRSLRVPLRLTSPDEFGENDGRVDTSIQLKRKASVDAVRVLK